MEEERGSHQVSVSCCVIVSPFPQPGEGGSQGIVSGDGRAGGKRNGLLSPRPKDIPMLWRELRMESLAYILLASFRGMSEVGVGEMESEEQDGLLKQLGWKPEGAVV